jgi:pyruvate,water dikinase
MTDLLISPWESEATRPLPSVEAAGGKGYGLYWLAAHGFSTPPTWVLSTAAFDLTIRRMELEGEIVQLSRALATVGDDWVQQQQTLDAIEPRRLEMVQRVAQAVLLDPIGRALEKLVLMPTQWAVRSSATVEDRPGQSFAGQFLSLLSVPSGRPLWDAIRQVWASTFRREVLAYCLQRGVPIPRMAVILQPMRPITAQDRSGVAFSRSPVSTMPGVLIQATYGAGETVVKGYGGDLYSVEGENVRIQRMTPPQIQITGPQGYLEPAPPPDALPLTEEEALHLAARVEQIAGEWEGPVNVEFVWQAHQDPQFVQVRAAVP